MSRKAEAKAAEDRDLLKFTPHEVSSGEMDENRNAFKVTCSDLP
jgi:hypothetical protein